jgi:hypothetical protein
MTHTYGTAAQDVVQATGFLLEVELWSTLSYSDTLDSDTDIRFAEQGIGN